MLLQLCGPPCKLLWRQANTSDRLKVQEFKINIELQSQKAKSQGIAQLKAVPREQAVRKGLIGLLGAWGLAVLTLPIPIAHFIAPPLLLLLGPFIGFGVYKLYHGGVDIMRGEAPCPDCGTSVFLMPCAERWPLDVVCPGCEARLSATRVNSTDLEQPTINRSKTTR